MNEEKYYTKGNLIKKLYRLAYVFHDIMIQSKIIYYACGGTLLGVIRHKGIIPWDNDIDFCIPYSNKEKFLSNSVVKKFKKNGYSVTESVGGWYRIKGKSGEAADVFFVEAIKEKEQWVVQHTGKALEFWPNDKILMKNLFPLVERQFGSGFLLVPNKPRESLSSLYGKDWNKIGYITMDADEHLDLDEPIKLNVKIFNPAKPFYYKKQIKLDIDSPYLKGIMI